MPVPFEALLPYAIMIGMFGISGTGLAVVKNWQNEGKRPRYSVDQWDRPDDSSRVLTNWTVMDRDRRLTGTLRGQTDKPEAPLGFELNNPWKLETRFS
ncbi:uncharacterized protein FFUJ_06030 [Fusarium fujikuroi IMI 58289]|uniref:NADH dehydrogenase [ubiquinone] 1 alpha subcomplex subunit 1 n=2 Tax=Fusarium fujikuroi TaxID=5127 RepID=S0E5P9_GIBF5|nr:uncharacterized protein FFUJ_06030 [Fusarium fujikuroi IMI 58289]KLO84185.1 uncharacterized protein LW93_975 [Fusarium fujikuroi]KLP04013.1 uncharacterized protein Y057_14197 [Fusarium fujikuroi]KLP12955.1 uncharacterized protein LW94_8030 [Fusarium fujikuroi]QGI65937.1 hypothetical protein CEK27_009908 [Fusarium fujikuroi]QGI83176.1 hypothetical protein CEK25_009905 [Fusarium fujikuroi]